MKVEDLIISIANERDMWKEKAMNMVEKETFDKVKNALAEVNRQPTVTAEAYDVAWKRIQTLEKRGRKNMRKLLINKVVTMYLVRYLMTQTDKSLLIL